MQCKPSFLKIISIILEWGSKNKNKDSEIFLDARVGSELWSSEMLSALGDLQFLLTFFFHQTSCTFGLLKRSHPYLLYFDNKIATGQNCKPCDLNTLIEIWPARWLGVGGGVRPLAAVLTSWVPSLGFMSRWRREPEGHFSDYTHAVAYICTLRKQANGKKNLKVEREPAP